MEVKNLVSEKEKLVQKKLKLEKQGKLLASKERKIKLKRLIELGDLVSKSGLEELAAETLLGALLEIKTLSSDESATKKWAEAGKEHLKEDRTTNPQPLIVQFIAEPSSEIKNSLRTKKFRWNAFRQEWYGYGKKDEISQFLNQQNANAKITLVDE